MWFLPRFYHFRVWWHRSHSDYGSSLQQNSMSQYEDKSSHPPVVCMVAQDIRCQPTATNHSDIHIGWEYFQVICGVHPRWSQIQKFLILCQGVIPDVRCPIQSLPKPTINLVKVNWTWYTTNITALRATSKVVYTFNFPARNSPQTNLTLVWAITSWWWDQVAALHPCRASTVSCSPT